MKVNLAVQVLSATVSNVLSTYSGPECSATAKFCSMMNSFFDCLNVRCTTEGKIKRNNFLLSCTSQDDERFNWLENVFLKYLDREVFKIDLEILVQKQKLKCLFQNKRLRDLL